MGPFSTPIPTRHAGSVILLAVFLQATVACEEQKDKEVPTEPWLKEEAERQKDQAPVQLRYQVAPEAKLTISLPGRRSKPEGTLSRIEGYVDFDLQDLAQSKGRIHVHLPSLQMNNLPRPEKQEALELAPELYNDATREALRWLGLGSGVSVEKKRELALAVFQFQSLRALSHPSAHVGSLRKSPSQGSVRQVYATAEGELSLRGFAVSRSFSTTLHFHFPEDDAKLPDTVEVKLRSDALIPLAEYEIAPRGTDGNLDTMKSDLVGGPVGSQVRVAGSLLLTRSGEAPSEPKTPAVPLRKP